MQLTNTFKEARRLHQMGMGVLWIKPKSKAPVESGWTSGERQAWKYLSETYYEGLNVGVRLGEPSKIGDNYLACIDVDIKDPAFRKLALAKLSELVGGKEKDFPTVMSGGGNGSRHLYFASPAPFKMKTIAKEKDKWEIAIYSAGRQMVLPPSVHPVTEKPYQWVSPPGDFPLYDFSEVPSVSVSKTSAPKPKAPAEKEEPFVFTPSPIHIDDIKISDAMKDAIVVGAGVTDRSGYLLPACSALVGAGLSQDEVLTILTERKLFLGACAYDHARTDDRARAAYWLYRYTLKKVLDERNAKKIFAAAPIEEPVLLSIEEQAAQDEELSAGPRWTRELDRTKDWSIRSTMKNCKTILQNVFGPSCFKLNEFSLTEEMHAEFPWGKFSGKELHDIDITMLKDWFAKTWRFEPADEKIVSAVSVVAYENRYHPVKTWLRALPAWDEVERVDTFLTKYIPCNGDEELRAVVGRRFLVSLVRRIFEPGCQSDQLLVLEGDQGIYKSSAFRALVGDEWFSDASFNVEDKDAVMVIFSKWLIEFGELSTLDRTTAEHTKAFITRRSDRIRAPFDRKAKDYPRQCLFVGSTNKDEYLKDDTGNRRYWPFKVVSNCEIDLIRRDREQLFAEALYLYECGEVTYLKESHLVEKMKAQQGLREMQDVLTEHVDSVVSALIKAKPVLSLGFTMHDLFETGKLTGLKLDQYSTSRVGSALRKLGFTNRAFRVNKVLKRVWRKEDPEDFR